VEIAFVWWKGRWMKKRKHVVELGDHVKKEIGVPRLMWIR
jgi:hypothetical protein